MKMAWTGLALTVDGQNALNNAQLSNRLNIKSIVIGDGTTPANFRTLKKLVHQLYEIMDLKIDVADESCTITADIPKMEYDYYFREIGVIVTTEEGEKLYVYDNSGDDAQYIVSTTGVESTRKRIRLLLKISDVAEITVSNPEILYVAYDDFEETRDKLKANIKNNADNLDEHITDFNNPHQIKAEQMGLDPTTDMNKPVSIAQQAALDEQYEQLTAYTRQKISDLINGAPESLDTLKEVADAIAAHKTIMDALDAAIGKKASAAEFDTHTKDAVKHITSAERTKWNGKADNTDMKGATASAAGTHGLVPAPAKGVQNNYLTGAGTWQYPDDHAAAFTSGDVADGAATAWTSVAKLAARETHKSIFGKISNMFKNVRYLYKMLGNTDISKIGDGTVTGALDSLNTGMIGYFDAKNIIKQYNSVTPGTTGTYTATQNCWAIIRLQGYSGSGGRASIDGVEIAMLYDWSTSQSSIEFMVPLKKGQILSVVSPSSFASFFGIYGMC